MGEPWKEIARRKQELRESLIPNEWRVSSKPSDSTKDVSDIPRTCGILTDRELDITENYDAVAIAEAIAQKKFTCVEVTTAFCKRAAVAQQLTNCLTEILFTEAILRARSLDQLQKESGKPVGPLHGVPISVKDSFRIAGFDNSIGIAELCFKPALYTSPVVSMLISAGAVILCKTNIPQTLQALDSTNNVFGRTMNPFNRALTAGGSTGGGGVLSAMKGCTISLGTDIGGSIRIPAMCMGIYGVKPSANRVPYVGQETGGEEGVDMSTLEASAGPIACSLRDCELLLRVIADMKPWERVPRTIPGNWNSQDQRLDAQRTVKTLTFGILPHDGLVTPLPPIQTLLNEVAASLEAAGHKVVHLPVPGFMGHAQTLFNKILTMGGGNRVHGLLRAKGEPLIEWLAARGVAPRPSLPVDKSGALQIQREKMQREFAKLWFTPDGRGGTFELDAIICPVAPHPVPPIDAWGGVGYTADFVLLDVPAGSIPVRNFTEKDLEGELKNPPEGRWDQFNAGLWDKKHVDRRVYLGSPLSVQVLAPRLQEKRLVDTMKVVDEVVKGKRQQEKAQEQMGGMAGAKL